MIRQNRYWWLKALGDDNVVWTYYHEVPDARVAQCITMMRLMVVMNVKWEPGIYPSEWMPPTAEAAMHDWEFHKALNMCLDAVRRTKFY
jgi:hypothetical protein